MSYLAGSSVSCGVKELCGINGQAPLSVLKDISSPSAYNGYNYSVTLDTLFTHIVFSDIYQASGKKTGGQALAKFIKEKKLGTIVASPPSENPNSGNKIMTWIWIPNKAAVKRVVNAKA